MEHPLAMDIEEMRRAGYATVDALVARLADPRGRSGAPPRRRRRHAFPARRAATGVVFQLEGRVQHGGDRHWS